MSSVGKNPGLRLLFQLAVIGIAAAAMTAQFPPVAVDPSWPRQIGHDGNALIIYQPQVDEWDDFQTLKWRMAFRIIRGGGTPVAGVLDAQGRTDVDNDGHMVVMHDIRIQNVYFPWLDAAAAASMEQMLRSLLPPSIEISLDGVVACTPKKNVRPAAQLNNDPPRIFVSYRPAILLDFAGQPAMSQISQTTLEIALNTSWHLFRDRADSQYYLWAGEEWMTAPDLNGPWISALTLPKDIENLSNDPFFSDLRGVVPRTSVVSSVVPSVFYSETPAEVIVFQGQPAYKAIPGTQLLYATNTASYVFRDAPTNQIYYLTAGRWFSASSLDGPWSFASSSLPTEFAKIPLSSPAAQVLNAVPGTEAAKDALLMAEIPTTAMVDAQIAAANARVTYDGEPEFAPIEGTTMQYAINTGQRVIQLGDVYYLCLQGVWFVASTAAGPWQTAESIPSEIYTIPPSSPVYNVTYVNQQTAPGGHVLASYTGGYLGAFAMDTAMGAVLVGGTGYNYPPYIGGWALGYPTYYTYPQTYGAAATRWGSYDPYTGTVARGAALSRAYGNTGFAQGYNPYTGSTSRAPRSSNGYAKWDDSAVSGSGPRNTEVAGRTAADDLYAGRDGNVYRYTASGWEKYASGAWNPIILSSQGSAARSADPDAAPATRDDIGGEIPGLERERQSRERGAQSFNLFQRFLLDSGFVRRR